jgi:hypothetical protein
MTKRKSARKKTARAATTAAGASGATAAAAAGNAPKKAAGKGGPFKVRATQPGFYDNIRRREGNVFTIQNEGEFSTVWMERVSKSTPEKTTTGQEEINRQHDEVLSDKLAGKATSGANPLGAE